MPDPLNTTWSGWLRPDGRKGIRNLVLVLYTVECAQHVAHAIAAGEEMRLPRPQWSVQSEGPPGVNVIVAVVAESPRDLRPLQGRKAGPFMDVLADLQGRASLQWLLGRSASADAERCTAGGGRRNLQVVPTCSDAYGAAQVEVAER